MSCAPQAHRRSRVRVGSPGRCVLGTAVHSRSAGRAARLLTPCLRFWLESLRDAFGAPLVDREARSSYTLRPVAVVAELADALDSGSSGVKPMEVQVLSTALKPRTRKGPRLFLESESTPISVADSLGHRRPERAGGKSRPRALQDEVQVLSTALKPRTRKGPRLFFGVLEHAHLGGRFTRLYSAASIGLLWQPAPSQPMIFSS